MISDKVQAALNTQLNDELFSSYLYLSMSAYFSNKDLNGFANWFRLQSNEEYGHAIKIYDYLHQVGAKVELKEVKGPKTDWDSFVSVFQETFDHEQKISKSINKLVDLAITEKDHATVNFMQWFVSEQVEEEATSLQNLKKIEMIGDNKAGLFMLDKEFGGRVAGQ